MPPPAPAMCTTLTAISQRCLSGASHHSPFRISHNKPSLGEKGKFSCRPRDAGRVAKIMQPATIRKHLFSKPKVFLRSMLAAEYFLQIKRGSAGEWDGRLGYVQMKRWLPPRDRISRLPDGEGLITMCFGSLRIIAFQFF